ncbi:ABC transporter substrate-binding protein [Niastella caeni]|uniref:ABC transporter substrate-binding protein n=1 Tax=Niastella caeni TaxID=2569763 RepID=A0A4V4H0W1_9BACT|nr:ABC transporter substrate-binding protein [Niastella caeni]THU38116.1 ABC transporter substrate-binding protein [Niastella caeni]
MKKSRFLLKGRKHLFLQGLPGLCSLSIYCIVVLLAGFTACKQAAKSSPGTVADKHAAAAKTTIQYSKGFTIEYFENYKLVKIVNRFSDKSDTLQYLLVQRGTPAPANHPGAQVIQIPVQKMVVTSSMHIALAEFAGAVDVITGLAEAKYVTSPAVRRNMATGKVVEVGNGSQMNHELIIAMKPDLVMTMGSPDAPFSRYQPLTGAGIPVMMNAEWLETDGFGRSEWVKLMAALLNKEEVVNPKFEELVKEYNRIKALAAKVTLQPEVVVGMPFKGTWFVPDGDSYITQLLKDAGAKYHWANVIGTGSLALNFETVAPIALKADFWLNMSNAKTKEEIAAADQRYTRFNSYRKGTMYNSNKRVNDIGANDFWESGAVNPHLILADLVKIFHPELLPDHQLFYYQQIQ